MTGHINLPNYLPSPARRTPTRDFDYQDLVADAKFHAVVEEHRRRGAFTGLTEGAPGYNAVLKEIALAFVRVVNEKRATLFRNRGILYGRESSFREAISCYNRALELSGNSPSRHVTLANRSAAYIKIRKYAEGLEDAEEAATLSAEYSIARSLMGYCQSQLGLMKEAVVNYNIALQLNPTDTSSRDLLQDAKNALLSSGETPEFIEELEKPFAPKPPVEGEYGRHRRFVDTASRTKSLQEMVNRLDRFLTRKRVCVAVAKCTIEGEASSTMYCCAPWYRASGHQAWKKASAIDKERQKMQGEPVDFTPERKARSRESSDRPRLARKLSSSGAQAFASLTQLPNKLKTAITTKKSRGRSDRKTEHSPDNGGQMLSLQNLNLTTTAAPGDDSGGGPVRPAAAPPLEVKLPSETPALETMWAATVATAGRPQIGLNPPSFSRAGKSGHDSTAPNFPSAGGNPAQSGSSRLGSAAATAANTPDKSIVRSSAGGPVDMRGHEGTGGGAASPDLAGYSEEELLRARRASPDPPPFKPAPGECPGTPAYPGYEEALEKQARKNERKRAAAVAYRPVFVPPEPDEGPIPPCPPAPRLGPVRGPGTGEKPTADAHQPEPFQERQKMDQRIYLDQQPGDLRGGGIQHAGETRSIFEDPPAASGPKPAVGLAATDPLPLRPSVPEKCGWAEYESAGTVSGQLRAAAAATAAATFPLPMGALKFLPCYSGKVPPSRKYEFPSAPTEPVAPEKVGWTSSESDGEGAQLLSDAAMDIAREGEVKTAINVVDKVWDCPEPVIGASVGCEGEPGGQSKGTHAQLNDAEASRQRRPNEVGHVGRNRATGAEATRLPETCLPDAASLAADERAKTIGHGSVRAAINLFERSARFQSGGPQANATAHAAGAPCPCLPQLPTRGAYVNEDATAVTDILAAEKARYHEDAVKRVTVWVEAVTMQPRGDATLSEWFRDGSVLVRLANTVKPGVARPGGQVAERSAGASKEPARGVPSPVEEEEGEGDAPTPTEKLRSFFEACLELGVPEKDLFSECDLEPEREEGLGRVVACLEVLGSTAVVAAPWYLGPTLTPPTPL